MKLSEREWTVLGALWETGGAELGTIVTNLLPHTGWNRNTVLTYLTRMEAKGLVSIDKDASPHIYHATLDREICRQQERQLLSPFVFLLYANILQHAKAYQPSLS